MENSIRHKWVNSVHFQYKRCLGSFIITMFIGIPVFNANSVDPDQTPRTAASDLGIHFLPMSHLWDARFKWANWFALLITKTCLYNFDPLKPHFYIVKLGLQGYTLFFLISAQNIDCGYSLEPPRRGGSNEYPQSMF